MCSVTSHTVDIISGLPGIGVFIAETNVVSSPLRVIGTPVHRMRAGSPLAQSSTTLFFITSLNSGSSYAASQKPLGSASADLVVR